MHFLVVEVRPPESPHLTRPEASRSSEENHTFDKVLELRNIADGAETSSAIESGKALQVREAGDFKAVFNVTALDTADLDETYDLNILVADTVANLAGSGVKVAGISVGAVGVYEVPLSGPHIEALDVDAAAITCQAVLGGTTPSITYGCHLAPNA